MSIPDPATLPAPDEIEQAGVALRTRPERYLNREQSWVAFNRRVLNEAHDPHNPLLERLKFLAIFASNLDEFFMIRVSGVKQQISAGVQKTAADGLTPNEQLTAIRQTILPLIEEERTLLNDEIMPELDDQGIHLLDYSDLDQAQKEWLSDYFQREVFPVLTPLAYDTSRPFPHISNLSLNLAVVIEDPHLGELFARIKIPEVLPRLVALPIELCNRPSAQPNTRQHCFVWIEQVIAASVQSLFPGNEVLETYPFRVTRNADMEIEEDEADDLLSTIEESVRQRRFGQVMRLSIDNAMPERVVNLLMNNLKADPLDIYRARGPLGLADLMTLYGLDRPDLKDPPTYPSIPAVLKSQANIFEVVRQGDILLHHPYQSFSPIIDFINAAAEDPDVLAIKQTLYRVGKNSPIVRALMHAREMGKQVTVLVELKARFDEENNITWARALERAGVHVVYGLLGLKIHAKVAMAVRKDADGMRTYVHLGTGNYNAGTARVYTDMGLLTCRPDLAADVVELFNVLTGYSRQRQYRKLLVAPTGLRKGLIALIEREIAHQEAHGDGHLVFKANALVDPTLIDLLYKASQMGVKIDLIIRGMCCLRPGIPGLSDHIHVRSIIGPQLEHSRIFYFHNHGQYEIFLGSADLMERNLDRRVEAVFPLEDATHRRFVRDLLVDRYLRDNTRAHILQADGRFIRLQPQLDEAVIDSQDWSELT